MRQRTAGTIAELWRYPVKSMLGEQRSQLAIGARGSLGDRAKALRDLNTGRIASAKRFPRLLEFRARYEVEPTYNTPGRIEIATPAGRTICADDLVRHLHAGAGRPAARFRHSSHNRQSP